MSVASAQGGNTGALGGINMVGGSGVIGGSGSGGIGTQNGKRSDPRFRSFVERYVVARAGLFRVDPDGHAEDMWACILDAKRCYQLIARTGRHIEPEDD